ncbi:hypothetical protein [Nocardioides sp.]
MTQTQPDETHPFATASRTVTWQRPGQGDLTALTGCAPSSRA